MGTMQITRIGPGASLQDLGRPGWLAQGLSRGGAADRLAVYEGAALLGQSAALAALELPGAGGVFVFEQDTRVALTGAPMDASVGGRSMAWNASHLVSSGAPLTLGAIRAGVYGYLHVGGGFDAPPSLGGRAAQFTAGLGTALQAGDRVRLGADGAATTGYALDVTPRFNGGTVRVVSSLQTSMYGAETVNRFAKTIFTRDTRANRMGVRLNSDGEGFLVEGGLSVLSEVITPGDIQVTGDGAPYVLMSECQTTGGYPRIATVLPADLPRVAQTPSGAKVCFEFVTLDEAVDIERRVQTARSTLALGLTPLIRDPHDISDLLSYQLISGVVAGDEDT